MTVEEHIRLVLDRASIGTLYIVKDDKPTGRYMTFKSDGATLYTVTDKDSAKLMAIEKNPNVHIILGYQPGTEYNYLEFEGKVTDVMDDQLRIKMRNFFRSVFQKEAAEVTLLKIEPSVIYLHTQDGSPAQKFVLPIQ